MPTTRKPAPAPAASAPDAAAPAAPVVPGAIRRERAVLDAVYPYAATTPRDLAYLAYFAFLADRAGAAGFSVADMLTNGHRTGKRVRNPLAGATIASAPAADAGAHNRAEAAGYIVRLPDASDGSARFTMRDIAPDDTRPAAIAMRNDIARARDLATAYAATL